MRVKISTLLDSRQLETHSASTVRGFLIQRIHCADLRKANAEDDGNCALMAIMYNCAP